MEGGANMSFMRVPFKLEQKFQYDQVNAGEPLPPIVAGPNRGRGNGMQVGVQVGGPSRGDSIREARRTARRLVQWDSTGTRTYTRTPDGNPNPVFTRIPCDSLKLANSPDLPPSIFDKGDEVFGGAEMDALVSQALSMG